MVRKGLWSLICVGCFVLGGVLYYRLLPHWPYIIQHKPKFGLLETLKTIGLVTLCSVAGLIIVFCSLVPYFLYRWYENRKRIAQQDGERGGGSKTNG